MRCLNSSREGLISWDKPKFGRFRRKVKELEEQLQALDKDLINYKDRLKRGALRCALEEFCLEKSSCGSNGERHSGLGKKIRILPIFMQGWVLDISTSPSNEDIKEVIGGMQARASDEMNEALTQPFTMEEVLANRLKLLLSTIIFESQSAFIPGRLINDNVLVAYEINHYLAHKYGGSVGYVAMKLDLSKAYNYVEWTFLERVLTRRVVARHEKYLRFPAVVGRSKTTVFQNLTDKVKTKLQSWKCKNLSQVGKVVLLKYVVQAIFMFVMSCFLVPMSTYRAIGGLMADFLHNKHVKKIHWLAWDKVCARKDEGGLDFRRMCAFSRAMLAKQL
ncbi:UNVERIFIED_CONTAM: hypothetical protein Sradi_2029900 [Sesamum radiatum]|uniref:Reverse transcriptase n=1 Tax=Sesamum radiatum TaxID=300843 RepID=A0AAW2TJY5_SESRA